MELKKEKCKPCEGGVDPLEESQEDLYLKETPGWSIDREKVHKIHKKFEFKDFNEAIGFVNNVAEIAEEEGHHPNMEIRYNKVKLELYTHAIGGLSKNDFIVAAKVNELEQ